MKFSSSPKRLFDMFRMRGLERAAAAISGNGCYFGAVAGDRISVIEVPLSLSRRRTRKCRRAIRRGGRSSHMFPDREAQLLEAAAFCLAPKLPTIILVADASNRADPGPTSQLPAVSRSASVRGP